MPDDSYIIFGKPLIGEEEIAEVTDCLRTAWLGTGPKVKRFREEFCKYTGAPYAEALHSCTAALFLAQLGLRIGPGDAVVTTPMTFCGTANSVRHAGATPLFADIERDTGLLDPDEVERLLVEDCDVDDADGRPVHRATGAKVRALLPVHFWGQPADVGRFRELCKRYNLYLIEDAAHAIETTYGEERIGTTADVTCFSFYSTKNLCTGEGGMITTPYEEVALRVRELALHGLSKDAWKRFSDEGYRHYVVRETGWKFNMMDLQAAIGIHQLAKIETMHAERERQWAAYLEDLADVPHIRLPPPQAKHGRHARHLFTLSVLPSSPVSRDRFITEMHSRGVGTSVHYLSLSEFPAYENQMNVPVPNSEAVARETVSIPLGGALTEEQRQRVVRAIVDSLAA